MSRIPLDDKEEKALESHRMIVFDMANGSQISMEPNPLFESSSTTVADIVDIVAARLKFNEDLTDLFIIEAITKEDFIKIRKMYRADSDTENRAFAEKIVEQLYKKHIG